MPLPSFILNDETKKNSHGFYLLNAGGRFDRFNNNPVMLDGHNLDRLVGKWLNLRTEGSKIIADPLFDEGTALGAERKGQVEREFLKGASLGIIVLQAEWRSNTATNEEALYVTEWEVLEASVTPVPSNAGAITLKLYGSDSTPIADKDIQLHLDSIVKLSAESVKQIKQEMEKITLSAEAYTALGINEGADMTAINAAVVKLRADLDEQKRLDKERRHKAAEDMVTLAISEGRIMADKKQEWINLAFEKPEMASAALTAIPVKTSLSAQINAISGNGSIPAERSGWTLLKWMKEDPAALAKIKANDQAAYDQIRNVKK